MARQTGQTFRIITESLLMASQGQDVAIVTSTERMRDWTFDKAVKMVAAFMEPEILSQRTLKIGDGKILFTYNKPYEPGVIFPPSVKVFNDKAQK